MLLGVVWDKIGKRVFKSHEPVFELVGGFSMHSFKSLFIKTLLITSMMLPTSGLMNISAKTLKIGTDYWPPYEDIFNSASPGVCTEVARAVFSRLKTKIIITQYPWTRAIKLVFTGSNDGLFCAVYSEERNKYCYFPDEPIASLNYLMFIQKERSDQLSFNSFADLSGKRIGVVRSFVYPKECIDYIETNSKVLEASIDEMNFKQLMVGRLDYAIADYANGILLINKLRLQNKVIPLFSKVIHEDKLHLIFSKKTITAEFVQQFSKELKKFKKTKHYRDITSKYYTLTP